MLAELLVNRHVVDQTLWDEFAARRVDRAKAVFDASNQVVEWQLAHVRGDVPGLIRGITQLVSQPAGTIRPCAPAGT